MFICTCGGVMLVQEIEQYPQGLSSKDKLEYNLKCTVKCEKCGQVRNDQKYD